MARITFTGRPPIEPDEPSTLANPAVAAALECEQVTGTDSITFSLDDGLHVAPTPGPEGISYTTGLIAIPGTDRLLATVDRSILVSNDRGCQWDLAEELLRGSPVYLMAGAAGDAFAWTRFGGELFRITAAGDVVALPSPSINIVGFGVDRRDDQRLRLADWKGAIWTSTDGGGTWELTGTVPLFDTPTAPRSLYVAAFAPGNLDRVVVGATMHGAFVSEDGGRRWRRSTGISPRRGPGANAFQVVFSPVTDRVVWAMAIDLRKAKVRDERHIYLSRDGGRSFARVLGEGSGAVITNGPLMAAHPTRPGVVYFEYGVRGYGTDLYRYDQSTRRLVTRHLPFDGVSAVAFTANQGIVMYLGLVSEDRSGPHR